MGDAELPRTAKLERTPEEQVHERRKRMESVPASTGGAWGVKRIS
jgi:hypothetical protein